MSLFTVLLLVPEYDTPSYGKDTRIYHCEGVNSDEVIAQARESYVRDTHCLDQEAMDRFDRNDLYVIAIFPGHLPDLNQELTHYEVELECPTGPNLRIRTIADKTTEAVEFAKGEYIAKVCKHDAAAIAAFDSSSITVRNVN